MSSSVNFSLFPAVKRLGFLAGGLILASPIYLYHSTRWLDIVVSTSESDRSFITPLSLSFISFLAKHDNTANHLISIGAVERLHGKEERRQEQNTLDARRLKCIAKFASLGSGRDAILRSNWLPSINHKLQERSGGCKQNTIFNISCIMDNLLQSDKHYLPVVDKGGLTILQNLLVVPNLQLSSAICTSRAIGNVTSTEILAPKIHEAHLLNELKRILWFNNQEVSRNVARTIAHMSRVQQVNIRKSIVELGWTPELYKLAISKDKHTRLYTIYALESLLKDEETATKIVQNQGLGDFVDLANMADIDVNDTVKNILLTLQYREQAFNGDIDRDCWIDSSFNIVAMHPVAT